jgi:lipopolysaccharide transport system permease protein
LKNKIFLLSELLRRDLASRYAGSFAGPFWAVLNPAIMCALYAFVFGAVLKVPTPEGFRGTFVEFLLAGMLPWLGIQEAIVRATTSVSDQAHLVKKLKFPVALLTLSSVGAALVIQAIGIALLTTFLLATGRGTVSLPLLLAAFAFELLLLAGPALILASLNPFFRDLAQILPPFLMIAFYVTPIFYPESLVPAWAAPALAVNPVRDAVGLFRAALFGMPVPPWHRLAAEIAAFIVLGFAGRQLYRRLRPAFADLL